MKLFFMGLMWSRSKFSIGDFRFIFLHTVKTWYLPLCLHYSDSMDNSYGIGFLTIWLEWSNKDSLWTKVMWETD